MADPKELASSSMTLYSFRWFSLLLWAALVMPAEAQQPAGLRSAFLETPRVVAAEFGSEDELGEVGEECSVGVACGKATVDGRPLLWKNRDAQSRHNVARAFTDGKHPYVAICDAGGTASVWGGANAAGFCIMNSVSRDLPQGSSKGPGNGSFMKLALQRCETVADFEALLRETDQSGRRTRANFGVIDAKGGAAIFETSHKTWRRFDAAADERGLVLRTNFATTANGNGGRERFARARAICAALPTARKLDHTFLLQQFCRDLEPPPSAQKGEAGEQDVRETIHRQTTVAAMVFHGAKAGEDPRFTTMWAILGQPMFSLAVPCFPAAAQVAPELAGNPRSDLCNTALDLAAAFYKLPLPPENGGEDGPKLEADVAGATRWLLVRDLPRVRSEVLAAEQRIVAATQKQLDAWRAKKPLPEPMQLLEFHQQQAEAALQSLREIAGKFAPAAAGR